MLSWANKQLATLAETLAPPPVDPTTGTTSASHLFLTALNDGGSGGGEMEALAIIRTNFSDGSFDPRMSLNVRGMTALHVASTKCAASIMRELLANASIYGMDVNSTDSEGNTALHHAAASSSGSGTGGIDPNQSLSIVKLLVEEYSANVLWKNYNGCTPYDMARSQTVRGYLLPKQLQAEAALGIMDDSAATPASLVNNAGPPPTSISTANISNRGGGEEEEEVYDPVVALMRPTVGALGNVRNYTSVPSLSASTTTSMTTASTTAMPTTMPTMMSSTLSSPMMMQTPSFHQQHQDQEQELLQPTSDNDAATAVVHPSSSSSSVLPEGWIECIDQNAKYYYNSITGVSSWDHPGGDTNNHHHTETIETNLQKDVLPLGWIECVDPTNNSMVYYYNETLGVSQWDRPTTTDEGADNVNWDTLQKDIAAVTVTDDITNEITYDIDNIVVEDIVLTNEDDVKVAETVAEESIQLFSHTSNECFKQPAISSATTTALMSSFCDDDDDNVVSPPPLDTTCNPYHNTESLYHQPPPTEDEMQPPRQEVHDSSSTTPSIIAIDKPKQNLPVKTLFAITPPFVSVTTPKQQQQQQQQQQPLLPLNAPSSGNTGTRGRGGGGSITTSATTSTAAATRLQQSSAPTSGTTGGRYALRGGHANAAAAILSSTSTSAPMSGGSAGSATRPRIIYKPDGFHSSSNDRELQLKYGHVANEHDQQRLASIGPPPTSLGSSSSTQQGVGGTTMPPVGGGYANINPYSASSSSRYPSAPSSFGGYDPNSNRGVGSGAPVVPAYATFQSPPPRDD